MNSKKILSTVVQHLDEVLVQKSDVARSLWQQLLEIHPADLADFLPLQSLDIFKKLFTALPQNEQVLIFEHLSNDEKIKVLSFLSDKQKAVLLHATPADELTDLFESVSNKELKDYLKLLSYHDRHKVLSLMEFDPNSAAGIMDTDVLTFRENFTVDRAISILQRLTPKRELYKEIYITSDRNQLVGRINLEDLVLKPPTMRLKEFMHKAELVFTAHEPQDNIIKKMIHYHQMNVPVVNEQGNFLGVIPSETLVDIIEQEAGDDVLRISAMSALPKSYFETSFMRLLYERSYILIILLLAQSFSTMIIRRYEIMLAGFLMGFITMLTSTGGNSSSQTSALVIQGMAAGEISKNNIKRFLKREFLMGIVMSLLLGAFSFARVYLTSGNIIGSIAVSISLAAIVLASVVLGSGIPILLKRMGMDPAFAAGPFLATLMDILGLLLYCYISSLFLT